MKFHLKIKSKEATKEPEEIEVNLDDLDEVLTSRLRKELEKLTLVIPGIIEWRWLLEELYYHTQTVNETDQFDVNNSNTNTAVEDEKMANLFQSIHFRLNEPFSTDSQIHPNEIFNYGQLLFNHQNINNPNTVKAHYSYFRTAFLVYYGNYPKLLLSFDPTNVHVNTDTDDLKTMRSKLSSLRDELILTML